MSEQRLSFCMLTTFYPPYHFGGDALYVYRLSNELASRGHRVVVAHCVDAYKMLTPTEPTGAYPNHPNVEVHQLKSRWGSASPLVTYLTGQPGLKAPALDKLFRKERFDVIHFHNISLIGGPGVLRYGDGLKLYTMHEHWLVCPMHVLWKYNREPCVTPDCFKCTLSFKRPPQLWRYTGLLAEELKHVDLFLSPSRFTDEQHRQRGFTYPIRQLPHFLPLARALGGSDGPGPAQPRMPYFLFVGRLERLKGLHTVIEQFRRYRSADLVIAGDGDEGPALRQQAADLPHVHFLGRVHPGQLPDLYAGAIAVLVPSTGYETFGMVSLEAFAQRTPVIVRNLGGLPEPVLESGGGFVYTTDDELVPAMEAVRTDNALRLQLGDNGYEAYRAKWSEEPHLTAYFAAIEEASALRLNREQGVVCGSPS
jgi:glycosyltransferase involved in cell wall biosynthesis